MVGLQPFDFPNSYIKNRKGSSPFNNSDFYIFGYDSINLKTEIIKIKIEKYKEYFYPDLNNVIS